MNRYSVTLDGETINTIVASEAFARTYAAETGYVLIKESAPLEPEPSTMSLEEAILDKLTELEYRQDIISLGLEGGATI